MTLTQEFEIQGFIRVEAGLDADYATTLNDAVWSWLRSLHGILRHDHGSWKVKAPWIGLKDFKEERVFDRLNDQPFTAAIEELLGTGCWAHPANWGGFLVKFPDTEPGSWRVPSDFWHVDFHYTNDPSALFGLRVFIYLSDVISHGGATLVVERSHQLVREFVGNLSERSLSKGFGAVRDRFNVSDPWLIRLTDASDRAPDRNKWSMTPATIRGVDVKVSELVGQCGDVYLMHPWLVHNASPNASAQPRFMRAKDIRVS